MRNWKRNIGLLWMCALIAIALSAITPASAAGDGTGLDVKSEAQIAADLGVLQGDGSGVNQAYLGKATQRIQAAIMYLRLKGLEKEALVYSGMGSFSDALQVGESNRPILAYLKAHPELGWEGVGDNKFDPLSAVTPQQFYKVLLEALGYATGTDFAYADTLAFAKSKGLYRTASVADFHNRDIATATVEALNTMLKDGSGSLAKSLQMKGIAAAGSLDGLGYGRIEVAMDAKLGQILVDAKGMTLYYFTKNVANPNACLDKCLEAWPIYDADKLQVPAGLDASDFGRFLRSDGKTQITYKGWPLYYFAADKAVGDTKGENVGKVWFVLKLPVYTVMLGTKADLGNYLTDSQGRALYYFDKDTVGKSSCSGACIDLWPVFHADNIVVPTGVDAKDFGVITRADGSLQTTYKGYPLYYYTPDINRGDTTGQAFKNVWYIVNPATFAGTTAQAGVAK